MKYKIGNGIEADGTPEEIARFLELRHYKASDHAPIEEPAKAEKEKKEKADPEVLKRREYQRKWRLSRKKEKRTVSEAQRKKNREYQRAYLARKKAEAAGTTTTAPTESPSVIALGTIG